MTLFKNWNIFKARIHWKTSEFPQSTLRGTDFRHLPGVPGILSDRVSQFSSKVTPDFFRVRTISTHANDAKNTNSSRVPAQDSHRNGISKNSSAAPSPHVQRPLTIAEKISNLIQVNMEGVLGKCHIFETTFSTNYQGSDSGTLAEAILATVLNNNNNWDINR